MPNRPDVNQLILRNNMRKILFFTSLLAVFLFAGQASASLYNYYDAQGLKLPSVSERTPLANSCGISNYIGSASQNMALEECLVMRDFETFDGMLGGTLPVAGVTYTLAGSGVTASATSVTLSSLTIPQTGYKLQDSDFSSTFYVTLEPGNQKRQEIASCTTVTQNANGSATLSGCSRGLLPYTPYTASSSYAFSHGGGTSLIFSDAPQLFNEYPAKGNTETVSGDWTYTSSNGICYGSSSYCIRNSGSNLQWTDDGWTSSYNFTSSSISQLTASTTQGIGITDSEIHINASSTTGMTFDDNGALYQKTNSTTGVESDSDGIKINTSTLTDLIATSTATADKIVMASSTGQIEPGWLGSTTTGDIFYNNGSLIQPLGIGSYGNVLSINSSSTAPEWGTASKMLYATTTANTISGTGETTIMSFTLPANSLGVGNIIRLRLSGQFGSSGGYINTYRVKIGSSTVATIADSSTDNFRTLEAFIYGAGTTSSQKGEMMFKESTTSYAIQYGSGTSAVDTTGDLTVSITVSASNAGSLDTIMNYGFAELLR